MGCCVQEDEAMNSTLVRARIPELIMHHTTLANAAHDVPEVNAPSMSGGVKSRGDPHAVVFHGKVLSVPTSFRRERAEFAQNPDLHRGVVAYVVGGAGLA